MCFRGENKKDDNVTKLSDPLGPITSSPTRTPSRFQSTFGRICSRREGSTALVSFF